MNGRTDRNDFVGVDALVGFFARQFAHQILHHGHTGRATNQDDFADLGQPCILQRLLEGDAEPLDQIFGELVKFGAGQGQVQMLGAIGIGRDVGQVDFGLGQRRQLNFRFLGRFTEPLNCLPVLPQINALVFLELGNQPTDDALVPVVATEVGVAVGGQYLNHPISYLEYRHVKRTATKVENEDVGAVLLV